jgi:hypothetical protein
MPSKSQTYDSSGPDIRVRGNAYQVLEKYLQLARDAGTAGDRVAAENFLQHADHYYRVVAAMNEGQRPRIGGREISVADVNVQNVSQGLSAALSGHGHSNSADDHQAEGGQPGNSGGNGQNRPQQQHQQTAPQQSLGGESHSGSGGNGAEPPAPASASGDAAEENRRLQQADEQPDYPEELLPGDQQQQDGQFEGRQHNRMGRGRRRGPGRRIREEGEGGAPAPTSDSDGAQ